MDRERLFDDPALPLKYLESYPYPVFVLLVPIPQSNTDDESSSAPELVPFTRSGGLGSKTFDILWSNTKWDALVGKTPLLECLDTAGARQFGDWLSGARKDRSKGQRSGQLQQTGPTTFGKHMSDGTNKLADQLSEVFLGPQKEEKAARVDGPPEGFWELGSDYSDPNSSDQETWERMTFGTGIEGENGEHPGHATLSIELVNPGRVTLEMTKTILPALQLTGEADDTSSQSHSMVIITTTPRSAFTPNQGSSSKPRSIPGRLKTSRPQLKSNVTLHPSTHPPSTVLFDRSDISQVITAPLLSKTIPTPKEFTSSEEFNRTEASEIDFETIIPQPSRPLLFNRDGTVSRPNQSLSDATRDRTDVHYLFETTDWSKTPLGPKETWPQSLKTMVSVMFAYPSPASIWWGKELTMMYNKANSLVMDKHPDPFGGSGPVAWAEVWSELGPLSELVLNGTPVWKEDDLLLLLAGKENGNKTFECYHTWMWVPIQQEDGTIGGLWNSTVDTTKKVLAERRLSTIRDLGERTLISRSLAEFDAAVVAGLESNAKDVPFFALYRLTSPSSRQSRGGPFTSEADLNATESTETSITLHRAASVGIPLSDAFAPDTLAWSVPRSKYQTDERDHHYSPPSVAPSCSSAPSMSPLSLEDDESPALPEMGWPIRKALETRRLVLVPDCRHLTQDYPIRAWTSLPTSALVIPIANDSDGDTPSAVLILGLNVHRPFDEEYETFVQLLRVHLSSGLRSAHVSEVENQKMEDLAALDRAKSLLFSNISHEFRTPLTLIAGPVEDVLAATKDAHKKEMLQLAQSNVRRLDRLISTLMDVSRLEAGKLVASYRSVNLGEVTRDLAAMFTKPIAKAKLTYTVDCDTSMQDTLVDPEQWEKIVLNLLSNAIKYTLKGDVKVSLQYEGNDAVLQVSDTGVGIPSSELHRIGERFHRVQSISRSHEGTGIGLALVKELTRLHHGSFEVTSVTEAESLDGSHGSTFRITLPLGSIHLPQDAIYDGNGESYRDRQTKRYGVDMLHEVNLWHHNRHGTSSSSSHESDPSNGPSSVSASRGFDPELLYFQESDVIMLVDDSYETRKYMRSIFSSYCTVIEARDGAEALELCRQSPPDLLITDVMMPNLDGFGLLTALKASDNLREIPIIMCTAKGGDDSKVEGLMAGVDDYLVKPFNARELIARSHIQLLLGRNRKELQRAFDEQTQELRAMTDYSPVGLFRAEEDQTIPFVNAAWYELSGYPKDRPMADWSSCIAESSRDEVSTFLQSLYQGSAQDVQSLDFQFTNGKWVTLKMIRLDLVSPGLKGLLGCVSDITERKQHEESQRVRLDEAEERRIQAEEARKQQELLIDITSHEIRNPISSFMQIIKTNLTAIQEQLEDAFTNKTEFHPTRQLLNNIEEDIEALESIYQCGLGQERICNDVLSLGRIQLDMLELFDVEINVKKEVQKVTAMFQSEARMNRIALSYKVGESVEILGIENIKTDPVRLGQVMTNLLSNGLRFTSTSDVRKIEMKFDLSLEPPDESSCAPPVVTDTPASLEEDQPIYLYIAVTDTGPGLTKDELELLFHRFSQVSPKTHTVFGGSGLGLFVCRRITNLMGGRIEVVSEYGHGSTFRFFIEARTVRTLAKSSPTRANKQNKLLRPKTLKTRDTATILQTIKVTGPASNVKPNILIVEDNLINQRVLARQLKHIGFTCEVANNGAEALKIIRKVSALDGSAEGRSFDCILMDLEMPIMDGLTAVRQLRAEEAGGALSRNVVIALTGNARQGQIDEARASGMDDVVIKPYRLDKLLNKMEDLMRLTRHTSSDGEERDMVLLHIDEKQ